MPETKNQRFKRLAEYRTNEIIKKIQILGNCSNRSSYDYGEDEVNKIFNAIDKVLFNSLFISQAFLNISDLLYFIFTYPLSLSTIILYHCGGISQQTLENILKVFIKKVQKLIYTFVFYIHFYELHQKNSSL